MPSHFVGTGIATSPGTLFSIPSMFGLIANQRTTSDPYFWATLTIQNAVVGSRYWVAGADDLSVVLALGAITDGDNIITDIPAYANPMLLTVRIRKLGYYPVEMSTNLVRSGAGLYVSQIPDTIAQ